MARPTPMRAHALPALPALPAARLWGRAASDRARLALVLLIALCQGALYLALLPPWQHYDEPTHFEYAWLIANHAGLPKIGAADRAMRRELAASMLEQHFYWNLAQPTLFDDKKPIDVGINELGHPPAYYLLVSLPLRLARHLDIVSQLYLARAVSVLLLLLTVAVAAGIMGELTPAGHDLRWAVPLSLALLPPFVDLMTAVNNDVGAVAVFSLFLWGAVRTIHRGPNLWRVAWVFATALLAFYTKNTAALALVFAPLACLVAFWVRRGWRWRWLVAGVLAAGLAALPLLFAWGDAAFWYRGDTLTPQAEANRTATAQSPLGDHALTLQVPAAGEQTLISPLVAADLQQLAGQTITVGGWVWADQPGIVATIGVAYKTPTQPAALPASYPITLTTVPTFVAWPVKLPAQTYYLAYQALARRARPGAPAAHVFVDGAVLVAGTLPTNQAPRFDDASAASGSWGGRPFTNLLRNPSAERGWPRLRTTFDQLLVRYIHRSPSQAIAALMDVERIAPVFMDRLVLPATDSMVQAFAWSHVRLSNPIWLYLTRALALLALIGGVRWLFFMRRIALRPTVVFLLLVGVLIWANTILRPLPLLGEVFVIPAARYTFPAISITMLALLGGWRALWPLRWRTGVTFGLIVGLIIMNGAAIQTIWQFYQTVPLGR